MPNNFEKSEYLKFKKKCHHLEKEDSYLRKLLNIFHDQVITIGVYPLNLDESCYFLALDFDKETWGKDAIAFLKTCQNLSIPAVLERSQSGNGAHIWIFFADSISARLARSLGSALLSRTMQECHTLRMESYDRLFPNQDTLPKGGFGNLIALPFEAQIGKSIDINFDGELRPDQIKAFEAILPYRYGILSAATAFGKTVLRAPSTLQC